MVMRSVLDQFRGVLPWSSTYCPVRFSARQTAIWYVLIPLLVLAVGRPPIEEPTHGIVNGLTGGDYGLASDSGNLIGGYSIEGLQFFVVVSSVRFETWGNELAATIAGPTSIVVAFILVALVMNKRRNSWKKYRVVAYAWMLNAIISVVYLYPADVFPGKPHIGGDGVHAFKLWQEMGIHSTWPLAVNGQHFVVLVAGFLTVVGVYILQGGRLRAGLVKVQDGFSGGVWRL